MKIYPIKWVITITTICLVVGLLTSLLMPNIHKSVLAVALYTGLGILLAGIVFFSNHIILDQDSIEIMTDSRNSIRLLRSRVLYKDIVRLERREIMLFKLIEYCFLILYQDDNQEEKAIVISQYNYLRKDIEHLFEYIQINYDIEYYKNKLV